MPLDPKTHSDWQIAQEAEEHMKSIHQLAGEFGLLPREMRPYGHYVGKIDYRAVLDRLGTSKGGKYIDVTAMTPTPLGEGKSTTIGLTQGLGRRGRAGPVHPAHPAFPWLHRGHQRRVQRAQGHGGPDRAHAARAQL